MRSKEETVKRKSPTYTHTHTSTEENAHGERGGHNFLRKCSDFSVYLDRAPTGGHWVDFIVCACRVVCACVAVCVCVCVSCLRALSCVCVPVELMVKEMMPSLSVSDAMC